MSALPQTNSMEMVEFNQHNLFIKINERFERGDFSAAEKTKTIWQSAISLLYPTSKEEKILTAVKQELEKNIEYKDLPIWLALKLENDKDKKLFSWPVKDIKRDTRELRALSGYKPDELNAEQIQDSINFAAKIYSCDSSNQDSRKALENWNTRADYFLSKNPLEYLKIQFSAQNNGQTSTRKF